MPKEIFKQIQMCNFFTSVCIHKKNSVFIKDWSDFLYSLHPLQRILIDFHLGYLVTRLVCLYCLLPCENEIVKGKNIRPN